MVIDFKEFHRPVKENVNNLVCADRDEYKRPTGTGRGGVCMCVIF